MIIIANAYSQEEEEAEWPIKCNFKSREEMRYYRMALRGISLIWGYRICIEWILCLDIDHHGCAEPNQ